MKRINQSPIVDIQATFTLNEKEMRALEALAGYGDDAFLQVFYEHMGKHYLRPHESGLRSLFALVRSEVPPVLERADNALKAFALEDPVVLPREEYEARIDRLIANAKAKG